MMQPYKVVGGVRLDVSAPPPSGWRAPKLGQPVAPSVHNGAARAASDKSVRC